jgi:hypothetical protein
MKRMGLPHVATRILPVRAIMFFRGYAPLLVVVSRRDEAVRAPLDRR